MWDGQWRRHIIHGYEDHGPARIPPLPQAVIMTDRGNGTLYFLSHTGAVGSLTPLLTTTLYDKPDVVRYGPYEGPYLNGDFRLYVSGGMLLVERIDVSANPVYSAPVMTRSGWQRFGLTVGVDPATVTVIYTEYDLS